MPYPVPEALLVEVLEANREIPTAGLATLTWGNVSGLDRASGVYVIKPSGVRYDELTLDSLVAVDVESGAVVGGTLKPSTDSETHRLLYRSFPSISGVTHTHSTHAVSFAQANRDIPVLGTTHADTFNGPVRCTRQLTEAECATDYELNTGQAIVDLVKTDEAAMAVPGALAVNHGPFTWGASARKSLEHAIICEAVAQMALLTLSLNPTASLPQHLMDRHFTRKHGPGAYYGNV
ncbi:L-ribulose-5-phosphate 4-epimerase [Acidothermaceae bacterium B102]|nr:L-ribulose-5-phosphate 4-epimerase [Acidothermaceae bacterium B102]